ncbi:hypothetical protein GF337_04185 [candidate division KSB1 bacterium]|nr:hypothetical protein [candidate division KSB1 bacterium]
MWWEYVIVFGAIIISTAYMIRYFQKKIKGPTCDCEDCPFLKNESQQEGRGKMDCCNGCAYLK